MTRAVAIISSLIAALFFVHAHGECGDIAGYEMGTDIEYCVVTHSLSQDEIVNVEHEFIIPCGLRRCCDNVAIKEHSHRLNLPARILNCVFRE